MQRRKRPLLIRGKEADPIVGTLHTGAIAVGQIAGNVCVGTLLYGPSPTTTASCRA